MNVLTRKIYTEENKGFFKLLLSLVIPIILQNFLNSAVNIADSFMIGRLGLNSINAVTFGNRLFFLYILLIFGITSGSSIFMGQFWGKGDVKSIHKVMGLCFIMSVGISFIFSFIALVAPTFFLGFFTEDPDVTKLGIEYLRVIAVSYIFTGISLTYNAALRSIGQTKIPMFTTLAALISNVLLNYLFIFVLKWGVMGAAFATTIARVVEMVAQIVIIYVLKIPVATKIKKYFKFDMTFLKPFFITILPVVFNEALWATGTTMYNIAYKGAGNEAQGAVGIADSIQTLFMVAGMSIGIATGIMMTNLLGANEIEKAKSYAKKSMILGVTVSVVMGVLLLIFANFILSFYQVSDIVKDAAFKVMLVIAISLPFKTFTYTTIVGILRSGGDTVWCLVIDSLAVWLIATPMAFLGTYYFKFPIYIIVAMVNLEEIFKAVTSGFRVFSNKWAKRMV